MRWRAVGYRWFVEYNPLYFASALSLLAGVFLLARELPADALGSTLGVAAVTEAYQVLLIAGAWLLLRAGLRRPAAILGLTALVFALDMATNGERLLSHAGALSFAEGMRARSVVPASVAMALFGPVKLWALARIFRLRGAGVALAAAGAVVFALPLLPYAVEFAGPVEARRQTAHLAIFWLGAPLLGWALAGRTWISGWAAEDGRARRIALATPFLVTALFAAHGAAWSSFPGLALSPAHAAPYLLMATGAWTRRTARESSDRAESIALIGTAAALGAALFPPAAVDLWPAGAAALLASGALLGLGSIPGLRLLLPAVVAGFSGAYVFASGARGPLPLPGPEWPAALAAVLVAAAATHRDFRCLFASAVAAGAAVVAAEPVAALVPLAIVSAGLWMAAWNGVLFPRLRGWVSFPSTLLVLAVGALLLWREPFPHAPWYAAAALAAGGAGIALRRPEFMGSGLLGLGVLAAALRSEWLPRSSGSWGLALVAAGFALLSGGVTINLLLAGRRPRNA